MASNTTFALWLRDVLTFQWVKNMCKKTRVSPEPVILEPIPADVQLELTTIDSGVPPHNLLTWNASRKIDSYHWWPFKEHVLGGCAFDPNNNLYAPGGGLNKYDTLFGTSACQYQHSHYSRKENDSRGDSNWAGFCDLASILSCLYEYPQHSVSMTMHEKTIVFTPSDIEALMIVACKNTTRPKKTTFYGERNYTDAPRTRDEPLPSKLVEILQKTCGEDSPFVMDIDCGESVWNYSFDAVLINEYNSYRNFMGTVPVNDGGTLEKIRFLEFIITSSAFPLQNQHLVGWVHEENGVRTEGWCSKWHPDFVWRAYRREDEWCGDSVVNPHIDTSRVYTLWKASLTQE